MKRYSIRRCEIKPVIKMTFSFEGNDITDKKSYTVYVGDCISFIYTNNMEDVGKNDKIVRGRVVEIIKKPRYNIRQRTPNFNNKPQRIDNLHVDTHDHDDFDSILLCIDESTEHNAMINQYPISKILDINDVDYEYPADNLQEIDTSVGLTAIPDNDESERVGIYNDMTSISSEDYHQNENGYTEAYNSSESNSVNTCGGVIKV